MKIRESVFIQHLTLVITNDTIEFREYTTV
jgi:hypothetical protein